MRERLRTIMRPLGFGFVTILATVVLAVGPAAASGGGVLLVAPLAGDWEVPPGDPDGTGSARITLNRGLGEVCWQISASDITLPALAAHIHRGEVGVAGPIVVPLSPPGADGKSSGCTSANRGLVKEISQNRQNFYVNVHTSDFPAGAVRGQLWYLGEARHVQDAIPVQFLNVSDWHGQLDPLPVSGVGDVGGAAQISTYWQADRAAEPNTLTLTAGDAYGAAPPLSGFFEERTAVMAMNLMGFDVDTFGNHNFDRGIAHLQEMIDLAEFQYVSANLANVEDNLTGVKPFEIFDMNGAKVAVIGLTNPEAPELVFPGNFGTIEVTDPVAAAMEAKAEAQEAGADVFVVITHMGVTGRDATGNEVGPLIDFANAVSGFDVIFGDHTDFLFSGTVNGQLVLENRSKGVTYARTNLTLDPNTGTVFNRRTEFVTPLSNAVTPDQAIVDMLAPFRTELAAIFDERIAGATAVFPRGGNIERRQEVAIGNLITDAMRLEYGTQLGFTNGGGIRAALPSSYTPLDLSLRRSGCAVETPCDIVVGDVFTVLPFGNQVLTRTVTGAQLWSMLENGVSRIQADGTGTDGRFPQISGFRFTFDFSEPAGSRVVSVELADGTPIPADSATYTLATNDFLNAGGDGYSMLADGEGVTRDLMANVVLEYIRDQGTITPLVEGRITKLP